MRLIRGVPGSGKTALVFREFKAALLAGRRDMRIIVPTATLVRHFQHELARDGIVFPPASVISLSRFALEANPNTKLIPDALLRAIARDTLRRLRPPEFAEVANTEGMADTLLETINLFENAGWTPEKLLATRKLTAHARAFQKLWAAIDAAVLAAGCQTRAAIFRNAVFTEQTHLSQTRQSQIRIWMDGFLNLSPLETHFVAALAQSASLTLTLTDARATDELRLFALRQNAQDQLLPARSSAPPRRPKIESVAAPTVEREADEIARRILAFHAQGTPLREIGVALRDASTYHPLLQGTFERFGIPARFYFATPLRDHPAATFLGGLINNVLNGWEFSAALETLQSHPVWGQSAAFDRFDFHVRERMPASGAAALLELAEEDSSKELVKFLRTCFDLDAWLDQISRNPHQNRPCDWARRFDQMARALFRPGLLEPAATHTALQTARSQAAALAAWTHAITTAATFWPEPQQPLGLADFWLVAREVVEGSTIQIPDDRREVVHVMSAFEARQWDVSALFVCGMTDRDYPRRNPQNLLFPDADIESQRLPLRKAADRDHEEKALWEALRTRARHSLILTYPQHAAGGSSVQSSRYLTDPDLVISHTESQLCRATPPAHTELPGLAGRIEAPDLIAALATRHQSLSLTALEDLAQCRFKFFAGRTLGLRPRPERPQERLQPKVTGLILHEALEAWLNNNREGDFLPLFETAFDNMVHSLHLPPGFRLEVERVINRETARKVSATEQWKPVSSAAEVELALNFPGGITVKCRVDRIDRMSDTDCIIVDYKSSRTTRVESLVESKIKLQGPLYALAAKEQLNLHTIAMMYVAVREDKRFGWGEVPGSGIELKPVPPRWMEDARDRSVERLTGFLSGNITAAPAEPDSCRWCDFKAACRVEQAPQPLVMVAGMGGSQDAA